MGRTIFYPSEDCIVVPVGNSQQISSLSANGLRSSMGLELRERDPFVALNGRGRTIDIAGRQPKKTKLIEFEIPGIKWFPKLRIDTKLTIIGEGEGSVRKCIDAF